MWLASRSQLKFGNCASGSRGSAPLTTTNLSNPQQISTNPHHIILEFRVLLCHHFVYLNSKIQSVYRNSNKYNKLEYKPREIAKRRQMMTLVLFQAVSNRPVVQLLLRHRPCLLRLRGGSTATTAGGFLNLRSSTRRYFSLAPGRQDLDKTRAATAGSSGAM